MSMEEPKVEHGKLQIFERQGEEGVWSVERVTEDGDIEQALFMGPVQRSGLENTLPSNTAFNADHGYRLALRRGLSPRRSRLRRDVLHCASQKKRF